MSDSLLYSLVALVCAICLIVIVSSLSGNSDRSAWCKARGMEFVGGGHSPILCYDSKTRLVYKPE